MHRHGALVAALALAVACSRTGLSVAAAPPCEPDGACPVCVAGVRECRDDDVVTCRADGSGWETTATCSLDDGDACRDGACVPLCDDARAHPSDVGCQFWSVDLDQIPGDPMDVGSEDYGVTLGNPWTVPVRVVVERNDAAPGEPVRIATVSTWTVPPLDHEQIVLPRREVDRGDDGVVTNSALTSHAYRITSSHPVTIVQANPLASRGFSRDTSLLLPSEMLGSRTTVVGWPQTIADGDTPETDFDPTRHDEDARVFLAIVGTQAATHVHVRIGQVGPAPAEVVAGGAVPRLGSGDAADFVLGAFDVLNLETRSLNADLTGTVVESDAPVAVFVGSEASDVPRFDTYATRICCADHLEEQLWPDRYAGRDFVVGRQFSRRLALARARGTTMLDVPEPEWARIVAVEDADLVATPGATVPAHLAAGEDVIVRVDASFELVVTSGRVHVMSALPSQDVIGVARDLPGGDPSLLLVPPVESLERRADLVVPDGSTFDFVTISAPHDASVLLDGTPLAMLAGPDGMPACRTETTSRFDVHQCELSFPIVAPMSSMDGVQNDGAHVVLADRPIAVTISGFQNYIGYASPAAVAGF